MTDPKHVVATRMIETRLHLYDRFFDHDWAQAEFARVPAQLTEAFEHLCLAWKEAANTHRLPWLMVQQMKAFADGVLRNHKPYVARFIESIPGRLEKHLSHGLGPSLCSGVGHISNQAMSLSTLARCSTISLATAS